MEEKISWKLITDEEKINYLDSIGARSSDLRKKNPVFFRNLLGKMHQAVYGPNVMSANNYFFESDQKLYRTEHFKKDEETPVKVEIKTSDLEKLKSKRVKHIKSRNK